MPHPRNALRRDGAAVPGVAPAVGGGVAVQRLAVPPGPGDADAVLLPRGGGEVEDAHDGVVRIFPAAQERDDAVVHVPEVDPLEALGAEVDLVERGDFPVEAVQVADEPLHPQVGVPPQQVPGERPVVAPLLPLGDLPPHEKELLSRVGVHVGVEEAEVGELPPQVARHLVEHRALQVHHLVVGEGEDEVFVEGVQQGEGELAEMVFPVDRVLLDEGEHVVHPPHVPFQGEPEPAEVRRPRHGRPGGRLLRDRDRAGVPLVDQFVHPLEKGDRLEVLVPPVDVRDPLARLPGVVEVEHRRHGVHPQAVDVVLVQPEEGVRQEEVRHLPASVVEDERSPVPLLPPPRVGVLVEVGPVEPRQPVGVAGKVGRHPVEDHADPLAVAPVDELHELGRAAVARRRREVPEHLVPPRTVERMLRHREELDVGVSHLLDVGNEVVGQLPVRQVRPPLALLPLPGAEVDLVHGHGSLEDASSRAALQPGRVPPLVAFDGADDRSRPRRELEPEAERVGLGEHLPRAPGADLVLVDLLLDDAGEEDLPDPGLSPVAHRVHAAVPMVEIADDGDALRVGRPHRERRAPDPADVDDMAPQLLVLRQVAPFGEEMDVEVGEDRSERVGVVLRPPVAVGAGDLEPVREDLRVEREVRLEHPVGVDAGHGGAPRRAGVAHHLDLAGPGLDHPDGDETTASLPPRRGGRGRRRGPSGGRRRGGRGPASGGWSSSPLDCSGNGRRRGRAWPASGVTGVRGT